MSRTAALFVLLAVVATSYAQDYCALCPDHTMCQYTSPGPKCQTFIMNGTSNEDIQLIVDVHNELRSKLATGGENGQPKAANMRKMTWDAELATVAQRWADQCDFGHDACRHVERFSVGQNAFALGWSNDGHSADWRQAIEVLYSEVKDFDPADISPFKFTSGTGHYTQIVWAETFVVGCGFTNYVEDGWYQFYYICNYGPAGNVIGGTMYKQGEPCTQCDGSQECQNGLCV